MSFTPVLDRPESEAMMRVVSAARTDVGLVRAVNEDSILVGPPLWAVADGMGGHAAGDVASRIVVETLAGLASGGVIRPGDILDALGRANDRMLAHERWHPATWGMGSTVTGLAQVSVEGAPGWAVFNVGDSRVYRCEGQTMTRVTVDHSEVEELVRAGEITREEARVCPGRNAITRSMGTDPAPQADLWVFPQTAGERFLLCSDGVTTELSDAQIAGVMLGATDPSEAAGRLLELTLAAGGRDNTSVIIVDAVGDEATGVAEWAGEGRTGEEGERGRRPD